MSDGWFGDEQWYKESELAKKLLHEAVNLLIRTRKGEHAYVPEEFWWNWTKEERQIFVREFHDWYDHPEDYNPENLQLEDWELTSFLIGKLLKENFTKKLREEIEKEEQEET